MNATLLQQLIEAGDLPGGKADRQLIETHISYVILNGDYAIKLKKPMHYHFLDFSSLEQRKFYCEREVQLNQRATEGVYLGVVPVIRVADGGSGQGGDAVVDGDSRQGGDAVAEGDSGQEGDAVEEGGGRIFGSGDAVGSEVGSQEDGPQTEGGGVRESGGGFMGEDTPLVETETAGGRLVIPLPDGVGAVAGEIIDYAVLMKRLDTGLQMHTLLQQGQVTHAHLLALADEVAGFHLEAEVVAIHWDRAVAMETFNDLDSVKDSVQGLLGPELAGLISKGIEWSDAFLARREADLIARVEGGYVRDVHGDLHARNIFLYPMPVLFDCIEFNDAFRRIDLLNEIAFFCMDLEAHGRYDLAAFFLDRYLTQMQGLPGLFDQEIFDYYKAYRANVRAKVNALRALQASERELKHLGGEIRLYLELMISYTGISVG